MENVKQKNSVLPTTEEKEAVVEKQPRYGRVSGCDYLNIRKSADKESTPVQIIKAGTKVEIVDDSDKEFYKVQVESIGVSGFCMKQYIERL